MFGASDDVVVPEWGARLEFPDDAVVVGSELLFSSSKDVEIAGRIILLLVLLSVRLLVLSLLLCITLEVAHALVKETRALFGDCLFICAIDTTGRVECFLIDI